MKILVACEIHGKVRDAFRRLGHDAWSCDILPSNSPHHLHGDVIPHLHSGWDMMIGHPPCTYLATCQTWRCQRDAARWQKQEEAVEFFRALWNAPIDKICLENPQSIASTRVHPKSQTIHPWEFGHEEEKVTWLWLKNLPKLQATKIMQKREQKIWKMGPSPDRSAKRAETYSGIATAMAQQWGNP